MTAGDHDRRDRHRDWLRTHGDELSGMGLPFRVFESADHWTDFLENGHLHWHEDAGAFSFEELHAEQRSAHTLGRAGWEIFDAFDTLCERNAKDGPDRLRRSDV